MKNYLIAIVWMSLYPLAMEAQEIEASKVPSTVQAEFQKMYPVATNIQWEIDGENYEASFKLNKKSWSAVYEKDGKFVESEVGIKVSELPEPVVQAILKEYPGASIEEAEKTTLSDGSIVYECELEQDKKEIEVQVSADGKILKKEESEEDTEDKKD